MLKQSALVLLLSILVVMFAREIAYFLHYVSFAHGFVVIHLKKIFAGGTIGNVIRHTIALFLISFIIALIPTGLYWAVTRKVFPYYAHILWVSWIILATMLVMPK